MWLALFRAGFRYEPRFINAYGYYNKAAISYYGFQSGSFNQRGCDTNSYLVRILLVYTVLNQPLARL